MAIGVGIFRIVLHQRVANVIDIDQRVVRRHPRVRVGLTVIRPLADAHRLNAVADHHFRYAVQVLIKAGEPQFKVQAVGEDQLRALRAFDIAGRRLIFMDLGSRFGDGADVGGVARDVLRHIGDHREGGNHFKFLLCLDGGDGQQRQRGGKHQMLQGWQVQHKVPHNVAVN